MFIGSRYKLEDGKERESTLGFKLIEVRERVLFQKKRTPSTEKYDYMLYCIVNGGDTAEILEDDLSAEIIHGVYKYIGLYKQ